jgi:Fe-S-cluster containining protein
MREDLLQTYPVELQLTEAASEESHAEIIKDSPWLLDLHDEVSRLVAVRQSPSSTIKAFRDLADRIAGAISPRAVCRSGCSHCCNIAVVITSAEASVIGKEIGIAPIEAKKPKGGARKLRSYEKKVVERNFGVPCPFLKDDSCSIYDSRPIACRLHFNIGHSSFFCSTEIPPEASAIPNLKIQSFWMGLMFALSEPRYADIRDFFPTGSPAELHVAQWRAKT